MKPEITICAASEVIRHVRERENEGEPFDAVLSFESPGAAKGVGAPRLIEVTGDRWWKDRQLILQFTDTERAGRDGPHSHHVQSVFDHCDRHAAADRASRILVHCRYGMSRSTAMTLGVLQHLSGPGRENEHVDELFRLRPEASPNLRIVKLADELTGSNGALFDAVKERRSFEETIRHGRMELYDRFIRFPMRRLKGVSTLHK